MILPLQIAHLIISVLLATTILLQQRSAGLGDGFGGDGAVFSSRRGVEKVLYNLTIVFAITFLVLGVLQLVLIRN